MMLHAASALCLLLVAVSSNLAIAIRKEKRPPQTLSRGWGDDITWVQTYEEGLFHTQKSNKPLMVIHHLEDCQYCQALKEVFAQNKEIQEMAQNNFIMLNLMHETTDKNLSPDGQYVPRIMFVDPSLTVRADIIGRYANRLYTYEPQDLPISSSQRRTTSEASPSGDTSCDVIILKFLSPGELLEKAMAGLAEWHIR
ncbi:PREDICTED: anterior gradient protein 3 isoform X1 [Hipposideros armiger]|uniref:Anterior gradient protein 3 isoform X1 n=1 Tax=Hipposideros armiger TaxID=186990 RepID=A0A8B7RYG4_HIPAR|nr:PREDICTED: anterior gradient protein 3 isoform X1 [Hipposideros armiger]XP_019506156.1 PREDICTED: anterior gradient protein 3 isoform X1 [Hipposideros armiger]